jgi:hypothetical protein
MGRGSMTTWRASIKLAQGRWKIKEVSPKVTLVVRMEHVGINDK